MRAAIVAGMILLAAPLAAQSGASRPLPWSSPASAPRYLALATSHSAATVKPGGSVSLFVDVAPNRGIHVYAPGATDYLPITLKLDRRSSVKTGKLIYPKSEILLFEPLGERVPTYQKPFRLTQAVTVAGTVKSGTALTLTGTVVYQACDDKVCFVPASAPVSWTINVK